MIDKKFFFTFADFLKIQSLQIIMGLESIDNGNRIEVMNLLRFMTYRIWHLPYTTNEVS